jgi:glycosyltransferase involved in cell wall biosynthesis
MPSNDVAIFAPAAACLYERRPEVTGGAERQATLLARGLAMEGLSVAHIVLPVRDPVPDLPEGLRLVQRDLGFGGRGLGARGRQLARVWSALREADAGAYVFRSGIPALGVGALFCRTHRRRLVFAGSNDLDFTFEFYEGRRPELELYKFGARNAAAIVVQNGRQAELARKEFPGVGRIVEIPSFAESAAVASEDPSAFLWVGRLDRYKQPLRYIALAEALPEAHFWMVARRLDPGRSGGSPGAEDDPAFERESLERAQALPNLELLEQRPHVEAMELVRRSIAVVNTGAAEGMPNLFLEAWARGVPVLSYEFDPDGRIAANGLGEVAGGSPAAFRAAAKDLWERRSDRAEVASRTRAYLEATHGVGVIAGRWKALIAELDGGATR